MPSLYAFRTSAVLMTILLLGSGCGEEEVQPNNTVQPDATTPGASTPPTLPADSEPVLRRLTQIEFVNSLRFVLGPVSLEGLEPDLYRAGLARVGARDITTSKSGVERFELGVEEALTQVFEDSDRQDALIACGDLDGAACAADFIARVGQRAWRRPLTAAEQTRYLKLFDSCDAQMNDLNAALRCVTSALLLSPYFMYRVEIPTNGVFVGYEMASRLSYFIWSAPPDSELLQAAWRGDLDTAEGVRAQAKRMLEMPEAHRGVEAFVEEWFRFDQLERIERDVLALSSETLQFELGRDGLLQPWLSWMAFAAKEEVRQMVIDQVFVKDGDYLDLLITDETFVDPHLKAFYELNADGEPAQIGSGDFAGETRLEELGAPDSIGFRRVRQTEDSPRRGIMGTMAVLSQLGKQNETSPTRRGLFIMERFLCLEVGAPPDEIDICERPDGVSRRESIETHHLCAAACSGCHSQMDPLGFALESFDTLGRFRQLDDWGFPLDTEVSWNMVRKDGTAETLGFDGLKQMATTFYDQPETTECVTRQIYRYGTGQHESDEAELKALNDAFVSEGRRLKAFMVHFVGTEAFRTFKTQADAQEVNLEGIATGLFASSCKPCHIGSELGGLSLVSDGSLRERLTGPSQGHPEMPLITPGDTELSYLWHKVKGTHLEAGGAGEIMPPNGGLPEQELEQLKLWIQGGLP